MNKTPEIENNPPGTIIDRGFNSDPTGAKWIEWEGKCNVPPVRFALVDLNKPYDLAQAAQVSLATRKGVPHIAFELIGQTLDFSHRKVEQKVMSWNIDRPSIDGIPRRPNSLSNLKKQGYRLIGTAPNTDKNALEHMWQDNDVIVIGGANGLSKSDLALMDEVITIPSEIPFMTTTTVIPILSYLLLNQRGLWKSQSSK